METIRLVNQNEIDLVYKLTSACGIKLKENGIDQWGENYPSLEIIQKDIENKHLYGLFIGIELVGTIVLNQEQDFVYSKIKWLTALDTSNLIIHRLAVNPTHQGKGFAKKLMYYAERIAKIKNLDSIRLDTYSKNEQNIAFYQKLDYQLVDYAILKDFENFPVACFEKLIS
jgi:ribosomal protein S18 acetylase RimI-like enzyme